MLEPVGGKQRSWHIGQALRCPTEEYPYIFTSKNSAAALDAQRRTTLASASNLTALSNTVDDLYKDYPLEKVTQKSWFVGRMNVFIIPGLFLLMIIIGFVVVRIRPSLAMFVAKTGRHRRFTNAPDNDDNDEVEIWTRPQTRSDGATSKTHGARMTFES